MATTPTTINLNFIQRLNLIGLLSVQKGNLGRTLPFLNVLKEVRWTAEEWAQIKVTPVEGDSDKVYYRPPAIADFGDIEVSIDRTDAIAVKEMIESWGDFSTSDHEWADPIIEQLQAKK